MSEQHRLHHATSQRDADRDLNRRIIAIRSLQPARLGEV
jgi:hypothetical protein